MYKRQLLSFLGWQVLYDVEGMVGMGGPHDSSLWFAGQYLSLIHISEPTRPY